MPNGLNSYPKYKDSDTDWLGHIPAHWKLKPLFGEFRTKNIKNIGLVENNVLSLSYGRIVVRPIEKLHGLVPASFETYQIVNPGDIIIRTTDLQNDHTSLRIGQSEHRGIITSAYMCVQVWNELSPEYGYHVLNTWDMTKAIYGYGSGLRQNLSFEQIKRMPIPVPPPDEQTAIVRFLDQAEKLIRLYIRAKRREILLLNEQKQAIIQEIVTKGINPDVQMVNSRIEWLGEIPAHWEILKLSHIGRVFNGTTPSRNQPAYWTEGTIPWLSSGKVNDFIVTTPSEYITQLAFKETSLTLVPRGSVIIGLVGQGKTRGTCAYLDIDACINQNLAAIVPNGGYDGRYLLYLLTAFYKEIRERGRGGNQAALNGEIVSSLRLPFPKLDEQKSLVTTIENRVRDINLAQVSVAQQIDLIREYRTRIIVDVVTGKLDVRQARFQLPKELEDIGVDELDIEEADLDVEEVSEVAEEETADAD